MSNNTLQLDRPISISWADILLSYKEGEEREYEPMDATGIRGAISRYVKYGDNGDSVAFTTKFRIDKHGVRKFYVRRLTSKEITQQQPSA